MMDFFQDRANKNAAVGLLNEILLSLSIPINRQDKHSFLVGFNDSYNRCKIGLQQEGDNYEKTREYKKKEEFIRVTITYFSDARVMIDKYKGIVDYFKKGKEDKKFDLL